MWQDRRITRLTVERKRQFSAGLSDLFAVCSREGICGVQRFVIMPLDLRITGKYKAHWDVQLEKVLEHKPAPERSE